VNVFLSWSGPRSKEVAETFYKWLPTVINSVEPFISQRNIEKGVVGQNELSQSLEEINFGIICLTKDNLHADWILYEAGALSKFQKEARVWTFLLDIKPTNISGPLSKFQHTSFEETEVFQLLQSINKAVGHDKPIKDELLEEIFHLNWERLKEMLSAIKAKDASPEPTRELSEINMEVLEGVRKQENITQKLIQQNEDIRRTLSQIANQLPRNNLNPYSFQSPLMSGISGTAPIGVYASGTLGEQQSQNESILESLGKQYQTRGSELIALAKNIPSANDVAKGVVLGTLVRDVPPSPTISVIKKGPKDLNQ
jgi:hypothetical protein